MQRDQDATAARLRALIEPRRPPSSSSRSASPSHQQDRSSRHPRRRYVGDGLDYRRPITLPSQASIVDLTAADDAEVSSTTSAPDRTASRNRDRPTTRPPNRLPRYPNPILEDVIDLESLPDRPASDIVIDDDTTNPEPLEADHNPSSPEVTFLHSRPRANPRPPIPQHRGHLAEHVRRHYHQSNEDSPHGFPMNMLLGAGFPFLRSNGATVLDEPGGYPAGGFPTVPGALPRALGALFGATAPDSRQSSRRTNHLARIIEEDANRRVIEMHNAMGFQQHRLRTMMQGGLGPAFHLANNFVREEPGLPAPTYDPVSDPRDGFTRSPGEDDVLVCPRCDQELCSGVSDEKQQAWVVKACGHVGVLLKGDVYCDFY